MNTTDTTTDDPIGRPVFVYGTLRPGYGNSRLWEGKATATDDGEVYVIGYALVTQGHFPYLVPAAAAQSVGCLIWPYATEYDDVLADMDRLEGVPTHYRRITVPVLHTLGLPIITAWTYVPAERDRYLANLPDCAMHEGRYDWNATQPRRNYRRFYNNSHTH